MMKSSKTGLMNQIRRALFQEDEENNNTRDENLSIGNSLVDHTMTTTTAATKSRRGQRTKSTTRSVVAAKKKRVESSSILADLQVNDNDHSISTHHSSRTHGGGMSVLAGMEQMSISSNKPSFRTRAPTNSMSVLAGIQDGKPVSASCRSVTTTNQQQGGFMSMFSAPPPPRVTKPKKQIAKTPVVGGLLGAVGVVERGVSKKQDIRTRGGGGKRGRPAQAKKRVSWANESSLVSNTTNNISVMAVGKDEPSARSQRAAARRGDGTEEDSLDDKQPDGPSSSIARFGDLQTTSNQMKKKGGKQSKPLSIMPDEDVADSQRSSKPATRTNGRNNRQTREKPSSTPEKEYTSDDDAFMMKDGSPMQVIEESDVPNSDTKPAKRVDTKPTPKKLEEVNDDSMAVSPSVPKNAAAQENQTTKKNKVEASLPFVPVSRVLEVEYLSPSITTKMLLPSPAIQPSTRRSPDLSSVHVPSLALQNGDQSESSQSKDSESTDTASPRQETRRSRRRPIPTNRFTPTSTAHTQKDQQETLKTSDSESVDTSPLPLSSPLSMESEPVKRRSARAQMPTDRFSPSIAMKQAQFVSEKPPRVNQTNNSKNKNLTDPKKKNNGGRPPRKSRRETGATSLSDSDADQHEELMDTTCTNDDDNTMMTSDEIQSSSVSSGEWNDSQLLQLKQAHAEVDPTCPTFWSDIAQRVSGRTAQECRDKWFSLVKTPAPRVRKAALKDRNVDELAAATEAFHLNDDEDDIFNSTPLRGALFPSRSTESPMDYEETIDVDFDVGSPVVMSAKHNRRTSTEYDDGNEKLEFQPKVGYKTYMMGLKRGVSRAIQEKKTAKGKKGTIAKDGYRTLTESVGNNDVSLKGKLSPGGTLQVKNLTETEDDFLNYLSEPSDDEQY